MGERKLFQKQDCILIAAILVLALVSFAVFSALNRSTGQLICRISVDGKIISTLDLSKEGTFSFEEIPQILFEVKDDRIGFVESDCPDKVCINSGFLGGTGQMAACLPNRVSICVLSDAGNDDIDMITN